MHLLRHKKLPQKPAPPPLEWNLPLEDIPLLDPLPLLQASR